jgi:hypothetical protein
MISGLLQSGMRNKHGEPEAVDDGKGVWMGIHPVRVCVGDHCVCVHLRSDPYPSTAGARCALDKPRACVRLWVVVCRAQRADPKPVWQCLAACGGAFDDIPLLCITPRRWVWKSLDDLAARCPRSGDASALQSVRRILSDRRRSMQVRPECSASTHATNMPPKGDMVAPTSRGIGCRASVRSLAKSRVAARFRFRRSHVVQMWT